MAGQIIERSSAASLRFMDLLCLDRKYLVYNLVLRNIKLRYRKSFFGVFWTVLIPASNALVYYFVFQFVMRVQIDNYLMFVLAGLIPWTFFSQTVFTGMESLVSNHSILNKVPVPPYAFPMAEALTATLNLLAAIPVLLVVGFLTGVAWQWGWSLLLLPLLIFLLGSIAYGLGLILSYAYVYLRDLRHLLTILLQIWFYLTPILYQPSMIPEKFRFVLYLNPVALIFEGFHAILAGSGQLSVEWFIVGGCWAGLAVGIAYLVARRMNEVVVENV